MAKAKKKTKKKSKGRRKSNKPKVDPYVETTNRIIAMIEDEGIAPWHKPWAAGEGLPTNLSTGKIYRGINVYTLAFTTYGSHYWLTFNQAKEMAVKEARRGGRKITKVVPPPGEGKPYYIDEGTGERFMDGVKKGEKKYGYVVFFKMSKYSKTVEKDGKEEVNSFSRPMLNFTPIFNVEQTTGITIPKAEKPKDFSPITECERLLSEYKRGPRVTHGGGRAFYSPLQDSIKVPSPESFDDPIYYYSTLFHEHVHATGHKARLNRKSLVDTSYFGSHQYSEEELVAEMGASFLSARTGINKPALVQNSAAYLKHWLEQIKKDPKLLVHSAARAQKAIDFMLGIEFAKDEDEDKDGAKDAVAKDRETAA